MRRLFWIALVALAACGGSSGPTGEDIIIDVSFEGVVDCFAADVDTVTIDWSNNALPSATIPCDSVGGVSFQYQNVAFGTYSATITGFSQGDALYAGRGPIQVDPSLPNIYAFDVPFAQ
jgi:hypothetical protein